MTSPDLRVKALMVVTLSLWLEGRESVGGILTLDCGGNPELEKRSRILGCFVSHKQTQYMTLENGAKRFPGLRGEIRMENSSRCFLALDETRDEMQAGFFECGSLIPRSNNQTENAVFARFKVSRSKITQKAEEGRKQGTNPVSFIKILLKRLGSMERRILRKKQLSAQLIPCLSIIFAGVNMLMTVSIMTKKCWKRNDPRNHKSGWMMYGHEKT